MVKLKYGVPILGVAMLSACGSNKHSAGGSKAFQASIDSERLRTCDKVLDGDLFNKVTSSRGSSQREIYSARFYSMTEDEAYDAYKEAVTKQGQGNIEASFVVKLVPVNVGGGGGGSFSREEFGEKYRKAKAIFEQSVDLDQFKATSSFYSTFVRDENSIKAWSECVKNLRTDAFDPVFFAVIERKDSKKALLHLTYSGGRYSGLVPKLDIALVGAKVSESTSLVMPIGEKTFEIEIGENETKIAVNGEDPTDRVSFSQLLEIPAAPESLDRLRCQIYTTSWFAAGAVLQQRYDLYKRTQWTTAPGIVDGREIGMSDCWNILDGIEPFEMEEEQ